MNVDRNELIDFIKYLHFRSLPTLETTMMAFGIQKVYGKAFEKLAAFLKDLGGGLQVERSDTLQNLLEALASGKYFDEHMGPYLFHDSLFYLVNFYKYGKLTYENLIYFDNV